MSGPSRSSAREAIGRIPPGARVILPHGCIEPRSLFDAIGASAGHPGDPPVLYGGMNFGDYGFLGDAGASAGPEPELGALSRGWRYVTWQVGPRIRAAMEDGRIGFLPLRFRDVPRVFGPGGPLAAEVALIQCTGPRNGKVSLGTNCSIFPAVLAAARMVIAEIHPDMPWTPGETVVPLSRLDVMVEATGPLGTLPRAEPDDVDRAIVERVLAILPPEPWVQLGVGAVPDCILGRLGEVPGIRLHSGMLTDPLAGFLDAAGPAAQVVTGEIEASLETYRQAASDPRVRVAATTTTHDLPTIARLERFVSINSAIEVDLGGQVNGEAIGGRQVSGVGGSLDFVEGARYSPGGMSIIALRSTARGTSRIVSRLGAGTPVSIPRFAADVVVTEHGIARLAGLDLEARAAALIAIAAPGHRAALRDEWGGIAPSTRRPPAGR